MWGGRVFIIKIYPTQVEEKGEKHTKLLNMLKSFKYSTPDGLVQRMR